MDCEILRTLYVKANGEVPCHDDYGERKNLGWVTSGESWSLKSLLFNSKYREIRNALGRGEAPWPYICGKCAFLQASPPRNDLHRKAHIERLQIESSLACALACPCCNRVSQIRDRPGPAHMDLSVFERLIRSIVKEGYRVDWIEYCGQGEPLCHPMFSELVKIARFLLPSTRQRLITNGNFDYGKTLSGVRLDEIVVSCDGLYQESYEKYRILGSVEKALRFMEDARNQVAQNRPVVIWKYILFEFNDSEKEIAAAQLKALELEVDLLHFVVTHSRHRSVKFREENLQDLLEFAPFAHVAATPVMIRRSDGMGLTHIASRNLRLIQKCLQFCSRLFRKTRCVIDQVDILPNGRLLVRGWALRKGGGVLKDVSVYFNGRPLGKAVTGLTRTDVLARYPDYRNERSGFFLTASAGPVPVDPFHLAVR